MYVIHRFTTIAQLIPRSNNPKSYYKMKRRLWLYATSAVLLLINCSEVPENHDPILGIWTNELSETTSKNSDKQEWIFNDAYLGRFTIYNQEAINFETDFKWEITKDNAYLISYPATDIPAIKVTLNTLENGQSALLDIKQIVAIRN